MVSDTSEFWSEFWALQGSNLHYSTSFHPKLMVRQKWFIGAWKLILCAFVPINPVTGLSGYLGLSIGTIPIGIAPSRSLLARLCMAKLPPTIASYLPKIQASDG